MKTITVNGKEYKLEFGFDAVEVGDLVQKMFEVKSGIYIARSAQEGNNIAVAMLDGTSEMLATIPKICVLAIYAGCLENNPVSEDEARTLLKKYMKQEKKSFRDVYNEIIYPCMEDDGFFVTSGIDKMVDSMNQAMENAEQEQAPNVVPQDHKKSSKASTK
jgi:hypothetical protein